MLKLTVLYGPPADAAAFEKYYAETHMPIASRMTGIRRFELAKSVTMPDGGAAPYYRMAEAYFDDAEHMRQVLETPEAQATVADLANFATGGVTMFVSEIVGLVES